MKIVNSIESLHPGNFALVMATGIISIVLPAQGYLVLSELMAGFAVVVWGGIIDPLHHSTVGFLSCSGD